MSPKTHLIPFASHELTAYESNGQLFVPIKPICVKLGIDWKSQHRKLDADRARWGVVMLTIPGAGGAQQTFCLPKSKIFGWLNSISTWKVSMPRVFPELQPVAPVKPIAPYLGGKRALARRLCAMIERVPHDLYAEPFVGMGGVFLRRSSRPKLEVVNDLAGDVSTLFRILQRHYQPFVDTLKWRLSSRAEFDRLMRQDPTTLTDLERSARFLYLQRLAFGGKVMGRNFGVDTARSRFNLATLAPMLDDIHDRLQGVVIEALPYANFVKRYDRPGALFYLDPPYWGCERDYGAPFERADFERLATLLQGLRGRFILSVGDRPELRELFAWATIEPAEISYRISGAATVGKELIISG